MKDDHLTRRAVLAGTASACLVAAVPAATSAIVTAPTIPPEVAAFAPDAARLLENGSPAARRMAAWLAGATDEQLDWLTGVVEQHPVVITPNTPAQGGAA